MEIHSTGWCCTDCIMILANAEPNPEWSEKETDDHYGSMEYNIGDLDVVCGGEHEEDCPNMREGIWVGETDCYCETEDFSWRQCDTCGTHLGGSRHAVTFFKRTN